VDLLTDDQGKYDVQGPGILVWKSPRGDFTRQLAPQQIQIDAASDTSPPLLLGTTRGDSATTAGLMTIPPVTLEHLLGYRLIRGGGLASPTPGSLLLDGRVVFRRGRDASENEKLPPAEFALFRGADKLGTVRFAADVQRVEWAGVDLPTSFEKGLSPGEYQLRPERGAPISFQVAGEDHPKNARLAQLKSLCGGKTTELFAISAATLLLSSGDRPEADGPFPADALRILESLSPDTRGPGAKRLIAGIEARFNNSDSASSARMTDDTGVTIIDAIRSDLAAGRWSEAARRLAEADGVTDPRTRRLAMLYRAVLAAESSAAGAKDAAELFQAAIASTIAADDTAAEDDLLRIRHNCANFLSSLALDRLQNRAFQAATGVSGPITEGLLAWTAARDQYEAALGADGGGPRSPATLVNLAQLYSLLADVVRSVGAGDDKNSGRLIQEAEHVSRRYAREASEAEDSLVRAAADLTLAELAFRDGDTAEFRRLADQARALYLREGVLAGVESVERTVGLFEARAARTDSKRRSVALQHLGLSQALAEILRDELPADRTGHSRAGFLARRVYVNERMIELLLADGKPEAALRIAETAKARALGDVLASSGHGASVAEESVDGLLNDWPADTAALEYYIGNERAWVFLVGVNGRVSAYELQDESGKPLETAQLVARTAEYLETIKGTAKKMLQRMEAMPGYDHAWQEEGVWFRRALLPDAALAELRKAKTALIVPHHVLHYFPFTALVIARDDRKRTASEMITPRFLIDEPFDVAFAPALQVWRRLRALPEPRAESARAVGISDFPGTRGDLPGVKDDLRNLRSAFGARVKKIYAEEQAVQSAALRALAEPGLVLFATHGQNVADAPLQSNLRLIADESGDDRLLAEEIFAANVDADLIVLSACFSGLADRSPLASDDLFGIQRALMHSGGRCVVSGLWDVFDTSGVELMNAYFQELAAGKTSPHALATAQRNFLVKYRKANETAGEPFLHPYFWAVYTSFGDDRACFATP
jgi:hypothetical protein